MYKDKIGIIGGFGAYATLNFYKRILEEFASDTERDYPHIVMDNNFTMASRTRALLYGYDYDSIVNAIAESMKLMCRENCKYIVMPCGAAHAFLNDIYKIVPEARSRVLNIIGLTGDHLAKKKVDEVLIIASEGTLKHDVYGGYLNNIKRISPSEKEYAELRRFIESVKKNMITNETADEFLDFLFKYNCRNVILGCTEFPVLVDAIRKMDASYQDKINSLVFYDPMEIVIGELKRVLK
ncbi:MAG: aspartate/glutamate racemase family protein [Porcipelethomonas sp.]